MLPGTLPARIPPHTRCEQEGIGIATLRSARWHGWQRWAPLLAAAIGLLAIGIPMLTGIAPDGPGLLAELLLGGAWLGVGLAVFTAYQRDEAMRAPVARAT